jgi:hypothetical protein
MYRDLNPRDIDQDRPNPSRGSGGETVPSDSAGIADPREPFSRDVDLPRGPSGNA